MDICLPIRDIYVRKILDSGGSPAVEAEVLAGEDIVGTASVAGQKGEQEIEAGIEQMHSQIAEELIGKNLFEQEEIDHLLEKKKRDPAGSITGSFHRDSKGSGRKAEAFSVPVFRWDSCTETSSPADPGGRRNCRRDRNGFQGTDACPERNFFCTGTDQGGR